MWWLLIIPGLVLLWWLLLPLLDGPERPLPPGRYRHAGGCAAPWQPLPCRTCGGGRNVA